MTNQESTATPRAVSTRLPDAVRDRAKLIEKARSHRKTYLTFFILSLAAFIAAVTLRAIIASLSPSMSSSHATKALSDFFLVCIALQVVFLVCFVITFLRAAREVHRYSTGRLIGYLVLLLIPIVSLIVMVVLDHSMYLESLGEEERPTAEHPHFSEMAIWSLSLVPFPLLGLPLAIVALRKIARSGGVFRGRRLAITSIVLNSLVLLLFVGLFAFAPRRNDRPRPVHPRRTHLTRP